MIQDDNNISKNFEDGNTNGVEINGGHLQDKLVQDKEFMNSARESYGEGIRR